MWSKDAFGVRSLVLNGIAEDWDNLRGVVRAVFMSVTIVAAALTGTP